MKGSGAGSQRGGVVVWREAAQRRALRRRVRNGAAAKSSVCPREVQKAGAPAGVRNVHATGSGMAMPAAEAVRRVRVPCWRGELR